MADTPEQTTAAPPSGATLTWAVRLLAAQTVVLAAVTALTVWSDLTADAGSLQAALTVTAYALVITTIFAVLTRALSRRRAWARSPAIVLELLLVPIGWYMVSGGAPWLGVPVLLVGFVGAGLLLAPATRAALGIPWRPEA
ncbi:hypothetical protein GCM10009682_57130 [Luedemannella flava]|uniref:Integral membrane protein n=1 Tax=Luedemannella flava TaxID=349316 RepID=A0ABP4YWW3_9ACTN